MVLLRKFEVFNFFIKQQNVFKIKVYDPPGLVLSISLMTTEWPICNSIR